MKKKHVLIGLTLAAVALLAAGCANSKSAEPAKSSHSDQTETKSKKSKTAKKAKTDQDNSDQQTNDQQTASSDNSNATAAQNSATSQTGSTNEQTSNSQAAASDSTIINDVITRMGYPSSYDASDFSIMRDGDRIDVAENHDSAHMKAAGAYPGVSPVIAHYQVINGHLYYLNPADNSQQAVN